ncbi:MAG: PH domain-containing protein [Acidimicrobiales bacterium]
MSFPARLLDEGEEVVLDLRPHWSALAGPALAAVVALAGGTVAYAEGAPRAAELAVAAAVVAAPGWMLARYLRWATTSLVLTSERLVRRRGILARSGREIPLDQISDISYDQRILQRILRCGDLRLESSGPDSAEVFTAVPRPAAVQSQIYRQMDAHASRRIPPATPAAAMSVPDQLGRLDELRRRGVITQAEFDAKKTQLLERM